MVDKYQWAAAHCWSCRLAGGRGLHKVVSWATFTVQAGARIADVIEGLRQHDLALQNIASIREQVMGGFVQARGLRPTALCTPHMDLSMAAHLLSRSSRW